MGYYLSIDDTYEFPLATITGWGDFIRWAESLYGFPEIKHLAEYGWAEPAPLLKELIKAVKEVKPTAEGLSDTIANMRREIAKHKGAEVVIVTDGMEEDDDSPDDPVDDDEES